jgi:hypothetical protein
MAEASAETPDAPEAQKRRRRASTGFPVIGLSDVSAVLTRAAQHGWEHTVTEIAGYLGHSTTNSGAFRVKLAALRDYGVVAGRGDQLEITDIGRTIAIPEHPDDRTAALQAAFMNTVFGPLYEESGKGTPLSVDGLARRAVNRLGIAAVSQSTFADIFSKSAVEAGLAEVGGDGRLTLLARGDARSSGTEDNSSAVPSATESRSPMPGHAVAPKRKPVIDEVWAVGDDGEVTLTIRLARSMSSSDFVAIGGVVEQIERLVAVLKSGGSSG